MGDIRNSRFTRVCDHNVIVERRNGNIAFSFRLTAADAITSLRSKYPGVIFNGDLRSFSVDDGVIIECGAVIDLRFGVTLTGETRIGRYATVVQGTIHSSVVDGFSKLL